MQSKRFTGLAVLLSTVCSSAIAQSGSDGTEESVILDEIVVTSVNRVATPVSDITRSIAVVTRDDLELQADLNRSVGAVLAQTVPGFSPSTEALTNFGQQLRGRNFQVLIDGVPQNTPLRDGQRSLASIDIDAIEQIEVIRGGTAIYGFGADGGLINYITRRPADGEFSGSARASVGFNTNVVNDSVRFETSLQASGRVDKFDYLVSGTYANRNNTFDADGNRRPADPVGAQGGLDETDQYNVLTKVGYQLTENQRLQASFNYFFFEQDADFGLRSSLFNPNPFFQFGPPMEVEVGVFGDSESEDPGNETVNAYLTYTHDDIAGTSVELQGYFQQIDTIFSLFPGFAQTQIESEKFGFRLTANTPVNLEVLPFDITYGVDFLTDETRQFDIGGGEDAMGDQDAIAGFAQIEIPVGELGILTGGIRYEDVSIDVSGVMPEGEVSGDDVLFNASASIFLTDQFTLFGGFSQSFSPGDILRVITDGSFATTDEVELEFVQTDNFEGGLRGNFDRGRFEVVGFFSESNNGTTFDDALNIITQPEEIRGVEVSLEVDVMDNLTLGTTFSYADGEVDLDDDGTFDEDLPTTRITPEKLTVYADFSPLDWWTVHGQLLYSGTQSNNSTTFGGGVDIENYVLVDLQSTFNVGPGILSIGITNLLNEDYFPVVNQAFNSQFANVQGPGRRINFAYKLPF
ncbi:MAG: TonB-dependent receptor [Pseudomonadota bacterium]